MSLKCYIQDLYSDLLATGVNSATPLLTIRLLRGSRSQPPPEIKSRTFRSYA